MPNWKELLDEIHDTGSHYDILRRKYLNQLHSHSNRNIIVYYSGWLHKPDISDVEINDADKNGFMTVVHKMDTSLGLDLILHTPGGDVAATESIIDYLRSKFGRDIRVFVPQLAMSGGTMIACAAKEIYMGKHSSLGPIDPQVRGIPAHGIIEEANEAKQEISLNPSSIPYWQIILQKYPPAFVKQCLKAFEWSKEIAENNLNSCMFYNDNNAEEIIEAIIKELTDTSISKSHNRHLSAEKCREIGLKIKYLEDDDVLQDLILSVHHIFQISVSMTNAIKIIQNQDGIAYVQNYNLS